MKLTTIQKTRLKVLEKEIEDHADGLGNCLKEIHESKLYVEHGSFEVYCKKRFNYTPQHCRRLIAFQEVASNISNLEPMGSIPTSERQARPLTPLPPEKQKEAWTKAVESANGKHPTAKQVQAAVDDLPDIDDVPKEVLKDPDGWEIPERAIAAIQFAPTIKTWCRTLDTLKREIGEACEERKPGTRYVLLATCESMLKQIKQTLWASIPEYVCPYCKGEVKPCKTCAGEGWVNGSTHYSGKSQREIAS